LAAAASLLIRMAAFPSKSALDNNDEYHHWMMTVIIILTLGYAQSRGLGRKFLQEVAMLADIVAKRLARLNIHYGWVIVAVTFVTLLTSAGAMGLPGALILPLNQEFHWDVGSISSALALRLALFGLMGPFSAALIERYGVRNIVITAVLLIVAGLLSALVMTELWQLVVLWGVVVGIGTGMTALVLGAIVSNRWFTAHRGLVLGMLTASSATGQLVFLPFAAWLVTHVGWRMALIPSIAGLGLAALLVILFMRDRPSDVGLLPVGETEATPRTAPAAAQKPAFAQAFATLGEASRSSTFWILAATFFICGLSTNGLVLRAARALAALPALVDLLALWAQHLCAVLRARLDRHRASDREDRGADIRPREGGPGVRLGVRGPSGRRGDCRLWRRLHPLGALDLPAGVLRRRRHVPGGGAAGDLDPQEPKPGRRATAAGAGLRKWRVSAGSGPGTAWSAHAGDW
jgi:MFS family permease